LMILWLAVCLQLFFEVQRNVCACIGPGDSTAQLLYVFSDFNISDTSENEDESVLYFLTECWKSGFCNCLHFVMEGDIQGTSFDDGRVAAPRGPRRPSPSPSSASPRRSPHRQLSCEIPVGDRRWATLPLAVPFPRRPKHGFAVAPSPQPLQPPNRRGSSPSTIQMLAAGNAHDEETPAAAFPFS
jgi:hypothetical protein